MIANVSEIFYSIQGEGTTIGYPAIFIRLCGCNLECDFCDTKYAQHCKNYLSEESIFKIIKKFNSTRIIFTGGEPVLQDKFIAYFINKHPNYTYQLETNGTIFPKKSIKLFNHITVSPKSFAIKINVLKKFISQSKSVEFKFAVDEDFSYELKLINDLNINNATFQPIWRNESLSEYIEKTKVIIEKIKEVAPNIRIIPQMHKILYSNARRK